jgi:hypothetical protein
VADEAARRAGAHQGSDGSSCRPCRRDRPPAVHHQGWGPYVDCSGDRGPAVGSSEEYTVYSVVRYARPQFRPSRRSSSW